MIRVAEWPIWSIWRQSTIFQFWIEPSQNLNADIILFGRVPFKHKVTARTRFESHSFLAITKKITKTILPLNKYHHSLDGDSESTSSEDGIPKTSTKSKGGTLPYGGRFAIGCFISQVPPHGREN